MVRAMFKTAVSAVSRMLRRFYRPSHLKLGSEGERIARRVLERSGMEFLSANFRWGKYELDLIFRDGPVLCFVEVKTRSSPLFAPETAVDRMKKKRIIRTGARYAVKYGLTGCRRRFDIVEVIFRDGKLSEVHHIRSAFRQGRGDGWI